MARCRWADGWAWFDFEADFRAWMQQAYPDVAAEVFPGQQISRDGRSAEIAIALFTE